MSIRESEQAINFFEASIANSVCGNIKNDLFDNSQLSGSLKEQILMGDSEKLRRYLGRGKSFSDSLS